MQKKENRIRLLLLSVIIFSVSFTVASIATAAAYDETGSQAETLTTTTYGEIELSNGDVLVTRNENGCLDMYAMKAFDVFVNKDGSSLKVKMAKGTVADALNKANIALSQNQAVTPALDADVCDGMVISITEGVKVEITEDGKTETILSPVDTVENALNALGYDLGKDDIVSTERDAQIKEGMKIKIQRVTYKEVTETEKISYDTVEKTSDNLDEGETKVQTQGKYGSKEVTKKIKYVDGKAADTEVLNEKIIKEPVDEVVLRGETSGSAVTQSASNYSGGSTLVDANGNTVSYSNVLTGSCTAYTAPAGAFTATGAQVYEGGVAVNPNIIPYGTKLYIASADGSFVYGYATAVDTGGALISGSALVDLFYFSYDRCVSFGRRDLNVYILS